LQHRHPVSRFAPVIGLVCLLCGVLPGTSPVSGARAQSAAASQVAPAEIRESVFPVAARATDLKALDPATYLSFSVCFAWPNPDDVQAYCDAVSDPKSPLFRQWLTPTEIADRFGPAPADYDSVISSLKKSGFAILRTYSNRMSVRAAGTADQVQRAFGTRLRWLRESNRDRLLRAGPNGSPLVFFANTTPISLPATIAPRILAVTGLES
jgi:kumamolisin